MYVLSCKQNRKRSVWDVWYYKPGVMYSQCMDAILQTLKPKGGRMLAMGYLMDRSIIEHIKNLYWWAKWFTRTVKTAFNSIHACASSILKMHFIFFLILQALISAPHFSCHLFFFFSNMYSSLQHTHIVFCAVSPHRLKWRVCLSCLSAVSSYMTWASAVVWN